MHDAPTYVDGTQLLTMVRDQWGDPVDRLDHQPVGFGAHHWLASRAGAPVWFVTVDELGHRHDATSLDSAYAGAAALRSAGLEFLHSPVAALSGRHCVPWAPEPGRPVAVSVTEWLPDAIQPSEPGAEAVLLARLHAATPPPIPRWAPLVGPGFADALDTLLRRTWSSGPFGEQARAAIRGRLDVIRHWLHDYLSLAAGVDPATCVATHGEPGVQNQLRTGDRVVLIDTESLKLAPAERDLARLTPVDRAWTDRYGAVPDPDLLRLFDLEWRLDEIGSYAAWFSRPHPGNGDDQTALGGLFHELAG